jgi:hypothetical protein
MTDFARTVAEDPAAGTIEGNPIPDGIEAANRRNDRRFMPPHVRAAKLPTSIMAASRDESCSSPLAYRASASV